MGVFDRFAQLFGDWYSSRSGFELHEPMAVKPATGLPMMDGQGGVDVAGNPVGIDLHLHLHHHHHDDDCGRHDH